MKKNILNIQGLISFRKKYFKILFSVALIFTLVVAIPISSINAFAALLEDCDLDGYDDSTGVPVPWPGYDETKGDTPSGPGGVITSTKAATNTTTATTAATTAATIAASTNNTAAGNTSDTSTGNTTNTSSGSTSISSTSNTNTSASGSSSSANTVSGSTGTVESNAQGTAVNGNNEVVASSTIVSVGEAASPVSFDTIINTKGLLKILDVKGSIIHAGSSIMISGSGFIGNIDGLQIEIHSEPLQLGTVTSSKEGAFETQISIPENLEAGTHEIVVLYQGKEIVSQQIEVAPKAADTFLEALTVGFSADNQGLVPGLLILVALIIVGSVTLLIGGIANSRRSNRLSEKVV